METDISPINDADLIPPPQHPLRHIPEEEEDKEEETPIYLPHHPPSHMNFQSSRTNSSNIFEELDKTAYIIIFVAFILGFFMGKTMQPVILRPG